MTDPRILVGSCLDRLKDIPDNSIDSIVTDPPYELGFMGKKWDASGIAYNVDVWKECLRVLKPGGHLLAFGGTRTYHRMVVAIEDAGFEVRDSLHWTYGSGFPKSLDISKALTKNGEDAEKWEGWGTALKPSHEPIVVARKPLAGTVAANVLAYGVGGINIGASRVGSDTHVVRGGDENGQDFFGGGFKTVNKVVEGRFPANTLLTHSATCNGTCAQDCPVLDLDTQSGQSKSRVGKPRAAAESGPGWGMTKVGKEHDDEGGASRFFTVTEWDPTADIAPLRYVAKPAKSERNAGLAELPKGTSEGARPGSPDPTGKFPDHDHRERGGNFHPTVKPVAVMRWLVRLVTPAGGTVLDPFLGSGTTAVAATLEGNKWIGCELTADYLPIIAGRVKHAEEQAAASKPAEVQLTLDDCTATAP